MKREKKKPHTNFNIFIEHLYALNNSKFFAGIIMLIMNIGSKYITLELSKSQEDYVKYTLGRQILVFAILWMGTRDIVVALILTCVFIVFADYLLNDNSKYCVIPNKYKDIVSQLDADGDGKISQKEINDAIHILKKARKNKNTKNKSQVEDMFVAKGLYKENFI
jgi:hypothetical protein